MCLHVGRLNFTASRTTTGMSKTVRTKRPDYLLLSGPPAVEGRKLVLIHTLYCILHTVSSLPAHSLRHAGTSASALRSCMCNSFSRALASHKDENRTVFFLHA